MVQAVISVIPGVLKFVALRYPFDLEINLPV